MRSLGDVLVVMVTCGERWPSVHAELVHRYDPGTAADARRGPRLGRRTAGPDIPGPATATPGEEATDPVVRRGRLLAADGMLRVEWPDEDEVTVLRGEHWSRRRGTEVTGTRPTGPEVPGRAGAGITGAEAVSTSVPGGGTVGGGSPRLSRTVVREQLLVRPWLLVSWLRLRVVSATEAGGRPATRLVGVPRLAQPPSGLGGLAEGAQRIGLVVDDETGVLVELSAYYEGRLIERVALRHLTLGDIADPRLFDLQTVGSDGAGSVVPPAQGDASDASAPRAPAAPLSPPAAPPGDTATRHGTTVPGAPASGAPASGTTVSGAPASGAPGSGAPGSGTTVSGTPASGTPGAGRPVSGAVPTRRTSGIGHPRPLVELIGEVDFRLCLPVGQAFLGRVEQRSEGAVVVAFPAAAKGELLTVSQSAGAGIADTAGWERISLPDGTPASFLPPDGDLLQGHLVFDRGSTRLWVRGVDRDAMTALALSLHPAR